MYQDADTRFAENFINTCLVDLSMLSKSSRLIFFCLLRKIMDKRNDSYWLMIASKSKDAIKLDIIKLNKSKTYPTEEVLSEDGLYRLIHINCNLVRDMEI